MTGTLPSLFIIEAAEKLQLLERGLLHLESSTDQPGAIRDLMRAAHSLKGAASVLDLTGLIEFAHAFEDSLELLCKSPVGTTKQAVDSGLRIVDLLRTRIGPGMEDTLAINFGSRSSMKDLFDLLHKVTDLPAVSETTSGPVTKHSEPHQILNLPSSGEGPLHNSAPLTSIQVDAQALSDLIGRTGENLVSSRRLAEVVALVRNLRKSHLHLMQSPEISSSSNIALRLSEEANLIDSLLTVLDSHAIAAAATGERLYHAAVSCRLRPVSDLSDTLARLVRDTARTLDKEVIFDLRGRDTLVDREVLRLIEAPLTHIIRNAIDHGLESPADRRAAGKTPHGTIRVEAFHQGGRCIVRVSDDGRGINRDEVRATICDKKLDSVETVQEMKDQELFAFLFLPGFSTRKDATKISGRGVGLDVVQTAVRAARGDVRVTSEPGAGTCFELEFPLSLSLVKSLLFSVQGELYALPLGRIAGAISIESHQLRTVEGRHLFEWNTRFIECAPAAGVLDLASKSTADSKVHIIVLSNNGAYVGLSVDSFIEHLELSLHSLEEKIGKVTDVSAAAVTKGGEIVVLLEADDLFKSCERYLSLYRAQGTPATNSDTKESVSTRVLVVDDSLTVRELERKLLVAQGFTVTVATDGAEGWGVLKNQDFDLVITDVDMPRLNGFELIERMKADSRLKALPVVIVSYKDRLEDKRRGLDLGADAYLTKGSFHDETFIKTVIDLIGGPRDT